jgi:hypothetical protein
MTITTDDTRSVLTSDAVRMDTQQAWDMTIGRNTAMLGAGAGSITPGGLARWAARRDPAGWVERRVSIPGDDEETRRRKALFTLALTLVIPFGVVWAGLYFGYGEPAPALAAMFYVVGTIVGIVLLFRFRNFALFCWTELALAFPVPVAQQLLLGGFVGSSAVILWSFLAALLALMFVGAREAWWWFGAFVVAVVACPVLQPYIRTQNHLPAWLMPGLLRVEHRLRLRGVAGVLVFVRPGPAQAAGAGGELPQPGDDAAAGRQARHAGDLGGRGGA